MQDLGSNWRNSADYYSTNTMRNHSDNSMFTEPPLDCRDYRYGGTGNKKKKKKKKKKIPTLSRPVKSTLPRPNITMCPRVLSHLFLSQFQYVYTPLTFDLDLVSE